MNVKVLDKIKKLLRLAKSSNPHEASLALSRAQKLMIEHNIGADNPELNGVCDETITSQLRIQTPPAYLAGLFNLVKEAFGCDGYFQPTFTRMEMVFIGHDQRPEIAGYVYTVLERQLTAARKEFMSTLSKRMKKANKTIRADQFCEGWVIGVYKKVEVFALSDDEKLQIESFKKSTSLEKANVRAAKSAGQKGNEARYQGFKESKNVVLNHGVPGQESKKLEASNG